MDPLSSLITFLQGLFISAIAVVEVMFGSATSLLDSFIAQELPHEETPLATIATTSVTQSPSLSTSTPSQPSTTTPKTVAKKPVAAKPASTTPTAVSTPLPPLISPEEANTLARASIVNILCTSVGGGTVRSISGSGVIIDTRGIILTNAHIAQYFLLKDYPSANSVDCVVRIGSPAEPRYHAVLLYLPAAWIDANASQIKAEHGTGTGENDYAFLQITSTTNPASALPASFTNIGMAAYNPNTGDAVLIAGYAAGFLEGLTIEKNLYATSAFSNIGRLYTFDDPTHVDVISLGGTVVSQGGSSGGAVVRTYDGKLAGIVATATAGETTAERDLRAITIGYINRNLFDVGKGGIVEFLSGDLQKLAADFASTLFTEEKKKLVEAIEH
jgi:hypothetical protein